MQKWTQPNRPTQSIGILLFDGFSNLCLANCIEPLRAANSFVPHKAYAWQVLSLSGSAVHSSSGLQVTPDAPLDGAAAMDLLLILASYGHARHDTATTRRALTRAAGRIPRIAGFDSAPWLMASAGLLEGHRATLHADLTDAFAERFHGVELIAAPWVEDGRRITCAGALPAYDLTRAWVVRDLGEAAGLDVDALFQSATRSPRPNPAGTDPMVQNALRAMRAAIETPRPLSAIAADLGVTARTMDRHCRAALGASPGQVYQHVRLSAARHWVENSALPLAEISLRCGFEDASAFTRAFKRRFGAPPSALRRSAVPR